MIIKLLIYINVSFGLLGIAESSEYCQFEVFSPKCDKSQVIIITEAKFGRMRLGKCLQVEVGFEAMLTNPQYLGCYVDVTDMLNDRCGGKNNCDLKVSDLGMRNSTCYKSLEKYLDVEYECLKVIEPNSHCVVSLATESPQYFFKKFQNHQAQVNRCGSMQKPFSLETLAGQKILITISDQLHSNSKQLDISGLNECAQGQVIGYITDKDKKDKFILCNGGISIPVSFSNHVELYLDENYNFSYLLKIEATGCSDLIPPADAWLKRTENEATIGCYSTRLRWQLKCVGQRWIGVIGNCSHVHDNIRDVRISQTKESNELKDKNNDNQVFTITIICAIGIILCSIIVCFGIICLKRYNRSSKLAESFLCKTQNFQKNEMFMKTQAQNDNLHDLYHTESKMNGSAYKEDGQYFVLDENLVDDTK